MIIVKLISGLGNQLFQYTLARQLAITNNQPLKLDVSFFENQKLRSYKLSHYNIKATTATAEDIEKLIGIYHPKSVYSRIQLKAEHFLPKINKRYYKEGEDWQYEPDVFKVWGDVYLDGYWQHYKYFENIYKEIFDELTLKDEHGLNSYKIASTVIKDNQSVSLHIRRGDYITDPNANNLMGVLPLEYYDRAVKYLHSKISSPSFYVFSDDLNWAEDNLKINAPVAFIDIDNGKKDYIELAIMSKCRHHIIANSSFSWWGAFLNRNPDKIVVCPDKWVVAESINDKINLQFPLWIKM